MEVVIAVAAKVAEYIVAPVGHQLGYIICHKSNVNSLRKQILKLEEAKDGVQHLVDAAKRRGEEIEGNVQNWITKVDDIVTDAQQLHDDAEQAKVGCCSIWSRHQLSQKAKKMSHGASEMLAEGKFKRISYRDSSQRTLSTSARSYKALESRTFIMKEIMQVLKDSDLYMIGLYGMGGIGKTSLAKEIAWQAAQDGSFDAVVMATVSNSLDVKRIQGQLGDGLGLKFDEETEVGRAHRLWQRIRKEKTVLIILDDIWQSLDLAEVGIPFGDDHRGCKLLLVSRNLDVLNCEMGTQIEFKLEILGEEESWSLFEMMAGDAVKDISLQDTAFKVARGCAGLPLLIVTVAKALKNKDLYAWKDASKKLTRFNHDELRKSVYSALMLSYNSLESDELKALFIFIGSIGQNAIGTRELLIYGWGLGIFKHVDTLTEARNRLYNMISSLKASSLLLGGGDEWVQMHDVVRDVAASISSRHEPAFAMPRYSELKEWPEIDQIKRYSRIFLPWCDIHALPEILECPELKILVLASKNNYLKVPDYFFYGMRNLKVLVLGGLNCSPSFHLSLRFLTNLGALYLYECMLEDISVVAEFPNLTILSLKKSEISELPQEIGKLSLLRLLDLSDCSALRVIPANLISSLKLLEELYMGNCFFQWEVQGNKNQNKNASLSELRHLHHLTVLEIQILDASVLPRDFLVFGKLESYKIFIGDGWKWPGDYKTSKTLKLGATNDSTLLDHGIKLLLNKVEDLYLAQLKSIRNVLFQLNREGFPRLKHLNIQSIAEVQYIINSIEWVNPHQAFPNLESLVIHNLRNLEKICHGPLPRQSFSNLKAIKVIGCVKLPSLFLSSMVKDLSQLLQIEISECQFMTEIITEQRQEDDEGNDQIMLPKLRFLTLNCLPMLVTFYSKMSVVDEESINRAIENNVGSSPPLFSKEVTLPSLETLRLSSINFRNLSDDLLLTHSCIQSLTSLIVDGCGTLNYLFLTTVAKRLVRLQYLEISNCETIDSIFSLEENMAEQLRLSEEAIFPNLETFVISYMDKLQLIWPHQLAKGSFYKLKRMEVKFCPSLWNLFPSNVLGILQNLETVLTTNCSTLEFVFGIQGLDMEGSSQNQLEMQLKTLTLNHLPKLKHVWSADPEATFRFQNLCIVEAVECESLSYVFPLSLAKELWQLQMLEIRDCGVEEIVPKDEAVEAAPRFVFPQLTSLIFWNLSELRSFYPGVYTFDCPILRKLDVYHCDKLGVFISRSQRIQEEILVNQQYFFSIEKDNPYLEELSLSSKDVTEICNSHLHGDYLYTVKALSLQCFHDESDIFPWDFLKTFPNLEKLIVSCSSFIKLFSSENHESNHLGTITKLRVLQLEYLNNLKYTCEAKCPIQSILQNLETLEVIGCSSLTTLVPSLVLFQNLDTLHVSACARLVNLISSTTARSLQNLRNMAIHGCEMIEEIVTCEDGEEGEIAFMKLECLMLLKLPRLATFCNTNCSFKFPLLRELLVSNCPRMETFSQGILSAPRLRKVFEMAATDAWRWEGDLNATIRKLFTETNSN